MLIKVNKLQKIQKAHEWRIIGETKFPYKEHSVTLTVAGKTLFRSILKFCSLSSGLTNVL